jgi:hypothetical protein
VFSYILWQVHLTTNPSLASVFPSAGNKAEAVVDAGKRRMVLSM